MSALARRKGSPDLFSLVSVLTKSDEQILSRSLEPFHIFLPHPRNKVTAEIQHEYGAVLYNSNLKV